MTPDPEQRHIQNQLETLSRRQQAARVSREELEAHIEDLEQWCAMLSRLLLAAVDDDPPPAIFDSETVSTDSAQNRNSGDETVSTAPSMDADEIPVVAKQSVPVLIEYLRAQVNSVGETTTQEEKSETASTDSDGKSFL